jgi:UDP-N-acetylmuramate--alanine ligase
MHGKDFRPDVVIGLGGLSGCAALTARHGAPLVLLEGNRVVGRGVRALQGAAQHTLTLFEDTAESLKSGLWVGPLGRQSLQPTSAKEARNHFGLPHDATILLLMGGSQGASQLNEFVAQNAATLAQKSVALLALCGPGKAKQLRDAAKHANLPAVVVEHCKEMGLAYSAADFVLCRGGASTVAELWLHRVPSMIVPYPWHKDRQQEHNARALGHGTVLANSLNAEAGQHLLNLLGDSDRLASMRSALEGNAPPDGLPRALSVLENLAGVQPKKHGELDSLSSGSARTAFFAGAGGCGMRGLASFLLENNWEVWGADSKPILDSDPLVQAGLRVLEPGQLTPKATLAVRSAAVSEKDPQFLQATEQGARPMVYAELLGEMTQHRPTLAVAGSHGKTTITAWIAYGMRLAGRDPGFLVGGGVPQLGGSASWGNSAEPLIAESCEYARTFHQLSPKWVALCNVDAEHPDTYPGGYPEVEVAFRVFLNKLPKGGTVYASPEAPDLSEATQADWCPAEEIPSDWEVGLAGHHNRLNAALVRTTLLAHGVEETVVREAISTFHGADRRMEELGTLNGALVVSDYAHHPVEVAATLQAASEMWPNRRLVVAFQPHQARRFERFRREFTKALDRADALALLPVYRARDPEDLHPETGELLAPLQARKKRDVIVAKDSEVASNWLRDFVQSEDILLCLGAGDIHSFARSLTRVHERNENPGIRRPLRSEAESSPA